jgi:hypothetical protein
MRRKPVDRRPRGAGATHDPGAGRMTRVSGGRRAIRSGIAYFIRRTGADCAVIALHPDDREETIASGLPLADAEDLCVSQLDQMRPEPVTHSVDGGEPQPRSPPRMKKHRGRQLVFTF